jgi:uncharacterized protein YwgA
MLIEQFRWLAGVIAAHQNRKLVGRTRLQKTIYLLQRKGLPTDFDYMLHFYGPYSSGLNVELELVEQLGLVTEEVKTGNENDYYVFEARKNALLPQIERFRPDLVRIENASDVALELAATYDAFRQMGYDHHQAQERLRRKKREKCTPENVDQALELMRQLRLPVDE